MQDAMTEEDLQRELMLNISAYGLPRGHTARVAVIGAGMSGLVRTFGNDCHVCNLVFFNLNSGVNCGALLLCTVHQVAALELKRVGYNVTIYESSQRVGGRAKSADGIFTVRLAPVF